MTEPATYALTSLVPSVASQPMQTQCIRSWRDCGLHVRSFNHPSEIPALARFYDVQFVPVTDTAHATFGRHYVPIHQMLSWAHEHDAPVLIINADIELRASPWELTRLRALSAGGICYIHRFNHGGAYEKATLERYGIDAFLLHGRDAELIPTSSLSMGQPFWDYWLPYTFALNHRPVVAVEFPMAFHRNHPQRWSWHDWHRCALEFARMSRMLGADRSLNACVDMAMQARAQFERNRSLVSREPTAIRPWVERTFAEPGAKTFLELGAHNGSDTDWLAALPGVRLYAFEPDPRNRFRPRDNVVLLPWAIGDRDGSAAFILSKSGWGMEWTHSSSLKRPKNHLQRYPVTFGETIEVPITTLDTFTRKHEIEIVDLIWADIQGAEGEMIRGGADTLRRARYLYTEYSNEEMYEGQVSLSDILQMLPDFRIVELWQDDVLLENRRLRALRKQH